MVVKFRTRTATVVCGLLLLAVVAVYAQTIRHEFINLDDGEYVYANPHVLGGPSLSGICWAFSSRDVSSQWQPVTLLSLMVDARLVALMGEPTDLAILAAEMHAVNVALHAANTLLVFLLLRAIAAGACGSRNSPATDVSPGAGGGETRDTFWRVALVAALFAVHPLHIESVAWISERKDVLSALFGLLALRAYVWYVRGPSLVRYLAVTAALGLGLSCKPTLVTWPLLFFLLDYWPLRRSRFATANPRGKAWRSIGRDLPGKSGGSSGEGSWEHTRLQSFRHLLVEKVPWLLLVAASAAVAFLAQHSGGAVVTLEKLPIATRFARAAMAYLTYLGKTIWPIDLAPQYPMVRSETCWLALCAAALLALLTAGVLWGARRGNVWPAFGWFWYLVTLVPTIGIVQVGSQVMADRFVYLPQVGLCIAAIWVAADLAAIWRCRRRRVAAVCAALLAVCAISAWRQTANWTNSVTLWTRAVSCTTHNGIAHYLLGTALRDRGNILDATYHFRKAVEVNPDYVIHKDLGAALAVSQQETEAIAQFRAALKIKPDDAKALNNLGAALTAAGRESEAIEQFRAALRIKPDFDEASRNLGMVLFHSGRCAEAVPRLQAASVAAPRDLQVRRLLAYACLAAKRTREAMAEFREIVRQDPDNQDALNGAAWIEATSSDAKLRNGVEAVALAERAATVHRPPRPDVLDTLAAAYAEAGRFKEAVETARKAKQAAKEAGDEALGESIDARIKSYAASKPYREAM